MAHEDDRNTALLRHVHKARRHLTHLPHGARRPVERPRAQRLNRVDHEERRLHVVDRGQHRLKLRGGCNIQGIRQGSKTPPAIRDLRRRLFAARVKDGPAALCHRACRLQQQRRLSDSRLATKKNHRAGHESPAEDAIEFTETCGRPFELLRADTRDGAREAFVAGRPSLDWLCVHDFFDERIPGAAAGAAPKPSRRA